jgi:hypothetical protein
VAGLALGSLLPRLLIIATDLRVGECNRATIAQRSPPLIGQLLVESLLLSVTGAAAFAWGSSHSGTV